MKSRTILLILVAVMVFACVGTALAASGAVTFNTAWLSVNGHKLVQTGQTLQTEAGASVPSLLCYTDENGGKTHYAPLRLLSETLGLSVQWRAGASGLWLEDQAHKAGVGTILNDQVKFVNAQISGIEAPLVSRSHSSAEPLVVKLSQLENDGRYITFSVTNHGTEPVNVLIGCTYGAAGRGGITPTLPAGQTMRYTLELLNDPTTLLAVTKPLVQVSNQEGISEPMNVTVEAFQSETPVNQNILFQ